MPTRDKPLNGTTTSLAGFQKTAKPIISFEYFVFENIENELYAQVRCLNKLVDQFAKDNKMDKAEEPK